VHHKVCPSEERRKVLSIAKRGPNYAARERLGGTDHAIDGVGIVHRDVCASGGGECGSRLTGAPTTEDHDIASPEAPRSDGRRLKIP
jgi:hypothetical protein